jgi:hypothetical protein
MIHLLWVAYTIWFPSSSPSFFKTFVVEQATIQSHYSLVGLCWFILNVIAALTGIIVLQGIMTLTGLMPSLRLSSASQVPFALATISATVATEPITSAPKSRLRWWSIQSIRLAIWNWTLISYKNLWILQYPNDPTLKASSELLTKAFSDAQALFRIEGHLLLTVCFIVGLLGWLDVSRLVKRISKTLSRGKKPIFDAEVGLFTDAKENGGAGKAKQVPMGILVEVSEVLETTERVGIQSQGEVLVYI